MFMEQLHYLYRRNALLVAPVQPATIKRGVPVAGAAVAAAVEAALSGRQATHDGFLVERRPSAYLGDGYHALSDGTALVGIAHAAVAAVVSERGGDGAAARLAHFHAAAERLVGLPGQAEAKRAGVRKDRRTRLRCRGGTDG